VAGRIGMPGLWGPAVVLIYPIGVSGQHIYLGESVLQHFHKYRQTRWHHREAGGQLFARIIGMDIRVEDVTGPRRADWRTRFSYVPNRRAEQAEIRARHAHGLHYVGDWHTHAEDRPTPSRRDIESVRDCFAKSTHSLRAFVLVIVGTDAPPSGLHVSLHDARHSLELRAVQGQVRMHQEHPPVAFVPPNGTPGLWR